MGFANFEFPHCSYYDSDLRELIDMYKRLIGEYSTILNTVEELEKKVSDLYNYVDSEIASRLAAALAEINAQIETINELLSVQERKIDDLTDSVNVRFDSERAITESELSELRVSVMNEIAQLAVDFGGELSELWEYVNNLQFTMAPIYNPVKGYKTDIEQAVRDTWNALRVHGYTVARYSAIAPTVDDYSNTSMTVTDYATRARLIIEPLRVVQPLNGSLTTVGNAVLTAAVIGATDPLTVSEYATLALTAEEYTAKNVTVNSYDYNGKSVIE